MSKIIKHLEIAANISIIVVSILIGAALVRYFFFNRGPDRTDRPVKNYIQKGQKLALQNVDWGKNGKTLLLVLQKGCHFCTDSAPFYKTLIQDASKRGDIHLVAVLPQPNDEAKKYLIELGVSIEDVRQESLAAFPIEGTPTLILVDSAGVADDIWVGKLKPDKEAEVLSRL
jgi:thioredoxin-related protein